MVSLQLELKMWPISVFLARGKATKRKSKGKGNNSIDNSVLSVIPKLPVKWQWLMNYYNILDLKLMCYTEEQFKTS